MVRTLFSFVPFMVCLFWFAVFLVSYKKHNPAKMVLTWFLLVCSVLYLCHGVFFTKGLPHTLECLWALCSLSVFPIYYLYIKALTTNVSNNYRQYLVLLPALIVALLLYIWPGKFMELVRIVLFTLQVVALCCIGIVMLRRFDQEVASCYANVEGRDTKDVKVLLLAFVLTSLCSVTANILGRSAFAEGTVPLVVVATVFATMLFALSYIGYTRDFSFHELEDETAEEFLEEMPSVPDEIIGRKLDELMKTKKFYLERGLKITDIASQIGSCRTYVSNYINSVKGETFSDYINRLRIEEAKSILSSGVEIKNISLAEQLGFANEQSFYRNFRKFTGMTPAQWKTLHR